MTGSKRIRVMYVVPDLGVGGAERHVTRLMLNLDRSRFDTAVVCIGVEGKLFGDLAGSGTRAVALHHPRKRQAVRALRDLTREMWTFPPDVVMMRGDSAETLGRIAAWLTRVSVPQVRPVVIGGGDRETELQDLARELGIDSRTTFLGVRRDVPDLLPGLDAACLSSVHEGVPITLIEAMAAGLPIVATDCGSVRDMVEDGEQGFVVPVGDVEDFADRLAHDELLRIRLGKSGRARVESEFQIQDIARGYEELLTDTLARKK